MIYIIIPVHNRLNLTKKCIESLCLQSYNEWVLFLVDDGSTDNTEKYINELKNNKINYIKGDGSLWWTGAIKLGIDYALKEASEKDYIMTVNNDIVFEKKTITNLIENIDDNLICSSISLDDKESEYAMSSGSKVLSWTLNITKHPFYGIKYKNFHNYENVELDMLTGRSVLYPAKIFMDGNNFDNINFPHYGGDSEFSSRAKKNGYKLILVPRSKVFVSRESTGLNPLDKKLSFKDSLQSLFSIKSTSNLKTKIKFSLKVPPWYAKPTYMLISILKVFILLIIGNFFVNKK